MTTFESIERAVPLSEDKPKYVARHRNEAGNQQRAIDDSQLLVKAAVIVCGAGALGAAGGILFRVAEAISAGVWMTLIGAGFAVVMVFVEKSLVERKPSTKEVADGSEGAQLTATPEDQGSRADELPARESGHVSVRDSGERTSGHGVHWTPALQVFDARGDRPTMVLKPATSGERRVRVVSAQRSRQRFSLVRNDMGSGAFRTIQRRGVTAVNPISSRDLRGYKKIGFQQC